MKWDRWVELIAIIAASAVAIVSLTATQRFERIRQAYDTWEGYFEFASENPKLASGTYSYPSQNVEEDEKYLWFVERMLLASEQILQAEPNSVQWDHAIMYEIREHRAYILSTMFLDADDGLMSSYCTYEKPVRDLVAKSFADANAVKLIRAAEADCSKRLKAAGEPNA